MTATTTVVTPAPSTTLPTTATTIKTKLHGRTFYESIGSPKYVVAPMVDQSEFAWRMLTRSYMTPEGNSKLLAYTPMFHARLFSKDAKYRDSHFQCIRNANQWLDGNPEFDRPLFVQFCANDPEVLLEAAKHVTPYCDAVDLNFGCPQGIAKRGHYGSFLQEDQDLIHSLVKILYENLDIPVTAKIRILDTKEKTLAYAKNVLNAGASIITVHGRLREQKGHLTGLADWEYIRYLRDNLPKETVIFANGNILQNNDIEACLAATGADAVMSAEGNLSDPAIFNGPPPVDASEETWTREYWIGRDGRGGWRVDGVLRRYFDILYKYAAEKPAPTRRPLFIPGDDMSWIIAEETTAEEDEGPACKKRRMSPGSSKVAKNASTNPNFAAVQTHLFHMLRHFVSRHTDVRDMLALCLRGDLAGYEKILAVVERKVAEGLIDYEKTYGKSWGDEIEAYIANKKSAFSGADKVSTERKEREPEIKIEKIEEDSPDSSIATIRRCIRPWWVVQPIVRPLPKEALAKGSIALSKKQQQELKEKTSQKTKETPKDTKTPTCY